MATLLLKLTTWWLGLWPEAIVVWSAKVWGVVWFDLIRYRRAVILENIERVFPERSAAERRALGRAACTHLVRTLFEYFRMARYRRRGLDNFVEVRGFENFEAAKANGKGVLCLSGHLGSPDLCLGAVAPRAGKVSVLVKSFPPTMDRFFTELRESAGLSVMKASDARRHMSRALRNNEAIVAVLDQNATRSLGVFVDFFGTPACTMSYLASYALSTGAAVVPCIPFRNADGTHVLDVQPAIPMEEQSSREATLQHMTRAYTAVIESAIRAHPEQWFWQHKRWKTRSLDDRENH